jgi:hypothetical protein
MHFYLNKITFKKYNLNKNKMNQTGELKKKLQKSVFSSSNSRSASIWASTGEAAALTASVPPHRWRKN